MSQDIPDSPDPRSVGPGFVFGAGPGGFPVGHLTRAIDGKPGEKLLEAQAAGRVSDEEGIDRAFATSRDVR